MGEFELLARVRERLPAAGPHLRLGSGDDAAVTVPDGATATSVDALVEGVHFRRSDASLTQIGHKALATALSDLAAMGAESGEAYVVLGVPPDLDEDGCMELLDGILSVAKRTGTTVAGGDITRSAQLILALTVVGHAPGPERLVTRAGARRGDVVIVSGELGAAAAGLLLLQRPELGDGIPAEIADRLRARQLEPWPQLDVGQALARVGATAMIDLSDGLGGDAPQLARGSGVGLRIDAEALPLADGVSKVAETAGLDPLQLTVSGGEDYVLLATLPSERLADASAAIAALDGPSLSVIGEVVDGTEVEIRRQPGDRLLEPEGFDQLGGSGEKGNSG